MVARMIDYHTAAVLAGMHTIVRARSVDDQQVNKNNINTSSQRTYQTSTYLIAICILWDELVLRVVIIEYVVVAGLLQLLVLEYAVVLLKSMNYMIILLARVLFIDCILLRLIRVHNIRERITNLVVNNIIIINTSQQYAQYFQYHQASTTSQYAYEPHPLHVDHFESLRQRSFRVFALPHMDRFRTDLTEGFTHFLP